MMTDHHFLHSLKNNQAMSWSIVLTELIDNAIDAQATTIVAGWRGKKFSLHDNGTGVSPAGFEALSPWAAMPRNRRAIPSAVTGSGSRKRPGGYGAVRR